MKCKITREGFLFIERGGKMKPTICPYQPPLLSPAPPGIMAPGTMGATRFNCGDLCPMFGEPEIEQGQFSIQICGAIIEGEAEEFEDGRRVGEIREI